MRIDGELQHDVDCCEATRRKGRNEGERKRRSVERNRRMERRIYKRNGERFRSMENGGGERKLGKGDQRMAERGSDWVRPRGE